MESRTGGGRLDAFFRGLGSGAGYVPAADWAAIVDSGERLALVTRFVPEALRDVYFWEAPDFYTCELETKKVDLPPEASARIDFRYQLFRGLSGVDAVKGDIAAHILYSTALDQQQPFAAVLEVSSTRRDSIALTASARLMREGKTVVDLRAQGDQSVSFAQSARIALSANLSAIGDGKYEIAVDVDAGGERISLVRPVELVGRRMAELVKALPALRKRVDERIAGMDAESGFALKLKMATLERAAKSGAVAEAENLLKEISRR